MRRALQWVVLSAVLLSAHGAVANTELLKTREGSLVHWARSEITVGLSGPLASRAMAQADVVLAVQRAADTWNAIRAGQPHLNFSTEPGPEVTIQFCRGRWRGDGIDLGKSKFSASLRDGTVTAATIEINECDHTFTAPGENAQDHFDLQAVMTHELGHVLGLGHSDNPSAIMHPSGRGADLRKPHAEDKTALAMIYFGRSPAEPGVDIAAGTTQAFAKAYRPAPGSDDGSSARPEPRKGAPPGSTGGQVAAPADHISVLSVTAQSGRQVLVYTCEPTLLPAMGTVPVMEEVKRSESHRARTKVR